MIPPSLARHRTLALVALLTPLSACGRPAASPSDPTWAAPPSSSSSSSSPSSLCASASLSPTLTEWRAARARLAAIRREAARPRTLRIALRLREPVGGRVLEARGAVAIAPSEGALRMILLGPGGTTALDLWIHGDRFRFAVPAIELVRRGTTSGTPASLRGLPVTFLRYWLLGPADGTLLWAAREPATDRFVLRDGTAIVDLRTYDDGRVEARRTSWSRAPNAPNASLQRTDEETVVAEQLGCGAARYHQASTGLDVSVTCEGEQSGPPRPEALVDPDATPQGDIP